jgi:hypothetical protein
VVGVGVEIEFAWEEAASVCGGKEKEPLLLAIDNADTDIAARCYLLLLWLLLLLVMLLWSDIGTFGVVIVIVVVVVAVVVVVVVVGHVAGAVEAAVAVAAN